jgi:hypothetical protein
VVCEHRAVRLHGNHPSGLQEQRACHRSKKQGPAGAGPVSFL